MCKMPLAQFLGGAIFLLVLTLWGACDDSYGCRLVMGSDLTSCSGIYVRAEDRKASSENMYPLMIYFGCVVTIYDSCWLCSGCNLCL